MDEEDGDEVRVKCQKCVSRHQKSPINQVAKSHGTPNRMSLGTKMGLKRRQDSFFSVAIQIVVLLSLALLCLYVPRARCLGSHKTTSSKSQEFAPLILQQNKPRSRPANEGQAASVELSSIKTGNRIAGVARTRRRRAAPANGPATSAAAKKRQSAAAAGNRQQHNAGQLAHAEQQSVALGAGRTIKNVTAQNGQSVLLHCLVEPNANGDIPSVSWFRGTGDLQLLSYEQTTIVQDERFVVRHGVLRENDWALQIKNVDKSGDAGLYQCQTASGSEAPQSQFYQLNIVEPHVEILGAPDLAVKLGAAINLTCLISHTADQLQYIFWYRNERMINYDISNERRGRIVTSKNHNSTTGKDSIASNLQIFSSRLGDSGNYTCQPSGARSASINLHVLEASSQQQTNSAVSIHLGRLDRGKAYAIFVAFVILSTWFNLIAQIQTGISFFLLAIIGFLLGHVTDSKRARATNNIRQVDDEQHEPASKKKKTSAKRRNKLNKQQDGDEDEHHSQKQLIGGSAEDALLNRANDAINLLKTLNSCGSESANSTTYSALDSINLNDDYEEDVVELQQRQQQQQGNSLLRNESLRKQFHEKTKQTRGPTSTSLTTNTDTKQQPSPSSLSASSGSASSSSTGYNSDSRNSNQRARVNSSQNVELVQLFCEHSSALVRPMTTPSSTPTPKLNEQSDEDDGQMIELVGPNEPSALEAVLSRLASSRELQHGCHGAPSERQMELKLISNRGHHSPVSLRTVVKCSLHRDDGHYSSPASLKRRADDS